MKDDDAQDARIRAILGDSDDMTWEEAVQRFCRHLTASLQLPCDVTGAEDFRWEEYYVFGPGDPEEYEELRKTRPSYQDTYELLSIDDGVRSKWMLFYGDLVASVRRRSDGKEFYLGLAELDVVDKHSPNRQLVDDYGVWFVSNR